jgi:hypothetical protein
MNRVMRRISGPKRELQDVGEQGMMGTFTI